MTNEERDRAIDFVIQNLAGLEVTSEKHQVRIEKLTATQDKLSIGWIATSEYLN